MDLLIEMIIGGDLIDIDGAIVGGFMILIGAHIITIGDGDQDGEETHIGIIGDGTIFIITTE